MNTHELKILPVHWENVKRGTKTFEIRVNDRAFQKGDKVILNLWYSGTGHYDGAKLEFNIGDVYPIDAVRVVFSLLPIS